MLTWKHSGQAVSSRSQRYTHHTPEFQVGTWATDELSQVWDRVDDFMHEAMPRARENVQAMSRVDTALMRSLVESTLAQRGEGFELEFGWYEGVPHYAPYQEFGTQYIEPMLAVHSEYLLIREELIDAVMP